MRLRDLGAFLRIDYPTHRHARQIMTLFVYFGSVKKLGIIIAAVAVIQIWHPYRFDYINTIFNGRACIC
jgi:hypothetical protein